jgi:hypothetical protein
LHDLRRRFFAARDQLSCLQKRSSEQGRLLSFINAEVLVARAQRQTVFFPHCRHADNLHREIQVAHHSSHNYELLKIFLAKYRDIGRENIEEFCHDGANALKMTGARSTAESPGQNRFLDCDRAVVEIHFLNAGPEEEIHARAAAQFFVRFFQPGITIKIGPGFELQWINETTNENFSAEGGVITRHVNQFEMSFMQSTHRRNEDAAT